MLETIRSLLAIPQAYQLFWNAIGGPERSRILVRDYIRSRPGDRILEIGCGPGTIVPFLPECDYVGFDSNPHYIRQASKRFPKAKFVCERVSRFNSEQTSYFDIVLALGIVHHLDDPEALQLFEIARDALKPGGRLLTLDGVWTEHQTRAAKYLLARDRGQFIRSEEEYLRIASQVFPHTRSSVREKLLRIPYTHIILECQQ